MRDYEGYVRSVKKGQVGKLQPGDGETVRGLALRISRAGSRLNKGVDSWVADGAVYFKLK